MTAKADGLPEKATPGEVALALVLADVQRNDRHRFRSAHEGYASILEDVDALWDAVKNESDDARFGQCKEAIHVAAAAIRFLLDVRSSELDVVATATRGVGGDGDNLFREQLERLRVGVL